MRAEDGPSSSSSDVGRVDGDSREPNPIELLRRRVAAAVRRTCPPSLAQQAEDIAQLVMMQLVVSRPAGEGIPGFSSTYLAKAAYGVAVDELRRRCRRREEQVDGPGVLDRFAAGVPGPEQAASSAEIAHGIRACLERIARPRRLALTLHLQGCTVPEAAGLLRWGAKTTENLVYRGLADLRKCLRGKGLEP